MNRKAHDGEETLATLSDGGTILIRSVRPADAPLFHAGFERLGERSRYRRFLGHKQDLTKGELFFFTHIDHHDHEAIGAIDRQTGAGVGVARFVRDPRRRDSAEAAVAVIDPWQGRGVGGRLLERLVERAHEEGVRHFTASLLTENVAMLELFKRVGKTDLRRTDHDVMQIDVHLPLLAGDQHLATALRAAASGDISMVPRDEE